jgi:hypothetical protein
MVASWLICPSWSQIPYPHRDPEKKGFAVPIEIERAEDLDSAQLARE